MSDQSYIQKLRSEQGLMTQRLDLEDQLQGVNRMNDPVSLIARESMTQLERFWTGDRSVSLDLMDSAKRFHVDVDLKKVQDPYASQKESVQKNLAELAKLDSSRTNKSRTKHMEKASNAYKNAALKRERMAANKASGKMYEAVADASESINQIIEGEIELVKASGTKNQSEAYELARLEVKRHTMLLNLYMSALREGNISPSDEMKLSAKISSAEAALAESSDRFRVLEAVKKSGIRSLENGESIMTSAQVNRYMEFYGVKDRNLTLALGKLLDGYHKKTDTEAKRKALLPILKHLETEAGQHLNDRTEMQTLLRVLKGQIFTIQERERNPLLADLDQYKELSNDDLMEMAAENKQHLSKEEIDSIYGKYKGKRISETRGYIGTVNGMALNRFIGDREGFMKEENRQIEVGIEDFKEAYSEEGYTEEQLQSYRAELNEMLDEKIRNNQKTVESLDRAATKGRLKGKRKLTRVTSPDFLEYGLGMKLTDDKGRAFSQQECVDQINKRFGMVFQNNRYTSTGNGVNQNFVRPQAPDQIMLTMLCEDGQKCFITENFEEGEVIFPRGMRYVIVGAKGHEGKGTRLKLTGADYSDDGKKVTFRNDQTDFNGIEIIVKVVKDSEEITKDKEAHIESMREIHDRLNRNGRRDAKTFLDDNSREDRADMDEIKNKVRSVESRLSKQGPASVQDAQKLCTDLVTDYEKAVKACSDYLTKKKNAGVTSGKRVDQIKLRHDELKRERDLVRITYFAYKENVLSTLPAAASGLLDLGRQWELRTKEYDRAELENRVLGSVENDVKILDRFTRDQEDKPGQLRMSDELKNFIKENQINTIPVIMKFYDAEKRAKTASKKAGLDPNIMKYCFEESSIEKLTGARKLLSDYERSGGRFKGLAQLAFENYQSCIKASETVSLLSSVLDGKKSEELEDEMDSLEAQCGMIALSSMEASKTALGILEKITHNVRLTEYDISALGSNEDSVAAYQENADNLFYVTSNAPLDHLNAFADTSTVKLTEEERQQEILREGSELYKKEAEARELERVQKNEKDIQTGRMKDVLKKGGYSMTLSAAQCLSCFMTEDKTENEKTVRDYLEGGQARDLLLEKFYESFLNTDYDRYSFRSVKEGLSNAAALEKLASQYGAIQNLIRENPGFLDRIAERRAAEQPDNVPEGAQVKSPEVLKKEVNAAYVKKCRAANEVLCRYRMMKIVVTDPYYRSHMTTEISKAFNADESPAQRNLAVKLNVLSRMMSSADYDPKETFERDKEELQNKLPFAAFMLTRCTKGEYGKNSIPYVGTQNEEVFEKFLKTKDAPRLYGDNAYKIAGDKQGSSEAIGRSIGVIASMAAIQNMDPKKLEQMLHKLSKTPAVENEGEEPSQEAVEEARRQNIEGLIEYKEVLKAQLRYMKKKYGAGYIMADPRVLAAHTDEIKRDYCFLTDSMYLMNYMKTIPGVMDNDDPEDRTLLIDMDYYGFIGSSYMFANRSSSNQQGERPYRNFMKIVAANLYLNIGGFAPEIGMLFMDRLEEEQGDILWNEKKDLKEAPGLVEGSSEDVENFEKAEKEEQIESGAIAFEEMEKARAAYEYLDQKIQTNLKRIDFYTRQLQEAEEQGDQEKIRNYREYISQYQDENVDAESSKPEKLKEYQDKQKAYDEVVKAYEKKYGHKPEQAGVVSLPPDKSDYKKIFSKLEKAGQSAALSSDELIKKLK